MVKRALSGLGFGVLFLAASAAAEENKPPSVHHAPPSVARANEPLSVAVTFDEAEHVKEASLVYKKSDGATASVPFLRSSDNRKPYVAIVPAEDVRIPTLAYAIEVETGDGARAPVFASRESMHSVALEEDAADARERALLRRIGGRRTTLAATTEIVQFGSSPATLAGRPTVVSDQFFRVEGQFTYRLLGTISEFGFRGGIVRGSSPVPRATNAEQFDVGMNYGAPRVRFRGTDWFHVEAEMLTSVNEIGYSLGGGGAILLGDAYGTHLTFGFEGIRIFGVRGYTRFDVAVARRLALGTTIEVTTMPHAETAGVRLVSDAKFDLGSGFGVGVRGGYQARSFASGGPTAGLLLSYSF